jgi:UDP-N-acetylmuramoylalanine--D-glutamate ligase
MELKDKELLIVGFGLTGEAVCRFALDRGARITISERRSAAELEIVMAGWQTQGVRFEAGGHDRASFLTSDLIVPSPGVPVIPQMEAARARGIPVLSEVELASRFLKGRIVGVTGSNGKSTVTTLIHRILKEAGRPSFLAGNIGMPLIAFVDESHDDHIYVTELSSFQLALTETLRPDVAVFLNISPDHLDWHPDFEDYFASKQKILSRLTRDETAVLNRDDPLVWGLRGSGPFQTYGFSQQGRIVPGCYATQGLIMLADGGRTDELLPVSDIPLLGRHNQDNVMAAALACHALDVPLLRIRSGIRGFQALEHRLEKVLTLEGVVFYNDSKATNVDAALKSLESVSLPIVLILGGRDKGGNFQVLRDPLLSKVKGVVLLGEAAPQIFSALQGTVPMERTKTMRDAVRTAFSLAASGEVVLLAPACTSFDMFRSFEHRGEVFKNEVLSLQQDREKEAE